MHSDLGLIHKAGIEEEIGKSFDLRGIKQFGHHHHQLQFYHE